ncbi:MAG: DUF971 domain-containing protein [Pseudobdellovibrionaceae bacterium]|jgi:DUF971 family protein|nr:DUF971 domain-containing protein [Pseudobdellovibrionaceae bacterium]
MTSSPSRWPTDITYKKSEKVLYITFDSGEKYGLTAELLRVESPSAEVQGHHPSEKVHVIGKKDVAITDIQPVGNYAVRLVFDDGHNTGLYSWSYLYDLAQKFKPAQTGETCGCGKSGGCH